MNDGPVTDNIDSTSGGIPGGGAIQNSSPSVGTSVESVSSTTVAPIGARERNLMYLITGVFGLTQSLVLILVATVWHLYNTTHNLPTGGLIADWLLGIVMTPYGGAAVVWLQHIFENRRQEKLSK